MPKLPKTKIKLTFKQWPGVEVTAGTITVGETMDLDSRTLEAKIAALAGALHAWNITDDDDAPVPCTFEGLKSLEVGQVMVIFNGWLDAITGVPDPLEQPSADTLPWEAASIPTEALS